MSPRSADYMQILLNFKFNLPEISGFENNTCFTQAAFINKVLLNVREAMFNF